VRQSEDWSIHAAITMSQKNMRNKVAGVALPVRKTRDPTILSNMGSIYPPAKQAIEVRQVLRRRVAARTLAGDRYHFFRHSIVSERVTTQNASKAQ
jgi:hypothetical protein